jgi:AmiR/NasT family two-component response regulator
VREETADIVHQAVALLVRRRRLSRPDALDRLHDIAADVGIRLHDAADLLLSLEES